MSRKNKGILDKEEKKIDENSMTDKNNKISKNDDRIEFLRRWFYEKEVIRK